MSNAADDFARGLMEATAGLAPLFEAAKGMRAQLEAEGWSPTAAETITLDFVRGLMAKIFGKSQ